MEKEKEYLLYLKGGIYPTGFNLDINSDCFIEAFTYEEYLQKFMNYNLKKYEISFEIIEGKKLFFLGKFVLKVYKLFFLYSL